MPERPGFNPFGSGPAGPQYDPTDVEAAAADLARMVKDEWRQRLLAAGIEASNINRALNLIEKVLPMFMTALLI